MGGYQTTYLNTLLDSVRQAHAHLVNFEPDAWAIGRGLNKLRLIEESIAKDERTDGRVNMMLKKEGNPVSLSSPSLPSKARGIQFNTNLRTAYEEAPIQFSLCKALAHATRGSHTFAGMLVHVVYTADMNQEDISRFATAAEVARASYVHSFIDERDGKNWDANVQVEHRQALCDWYEAVNPKLAEIARANIKVRGVYRNGPFKITYDIDGTVKSGHFDTSSGNGALNVDITVTAISKLPGRLRPVRVEGMVMGDDLILWLYFDHVVDPKEYCEAINSLEREAGIQPVRGIFDDLRNASFCSMGFYTSHNGFVALPKLGRLFARLFWTVTPLEGRDPARLASTIANSFYPMYHEYAPMREFLRAHMHARPLELTGVNVPYLIRNGPLPRVSGVHWIGDHIVKYGLPGGVLEEMPELVKDFTGILDHPVVNIMLKEDMSDPPERRGCLAF